MVRAKICGITNVDDALEAVRLGADALGFVFYSGSPRHVTPDEVLAITKKLPPLVTLVGVFVNEPPNVVHGIAERCGIDVVQLHGDETPEHCNMMNLRVIKAFRVRDWSSLDPVNSYNVSAVLLDSYTAQEFGGSGKRFNWDIAREAAKTRPVILSGGLTPENVAEAAARVQPYGVDVSTGVEVQGNKRRKDFGKMKAFMNNLRSAHVSLTREGGLS
jgi:phosphoribosylanthranilate isomerase